MTPTYKTFKTIFNSYSVQEVLGEGGSGRAFKVEDANGEVFAIKCLDPHKTTTDKVKRFKNELFFCLRNKHPNIVRVLDYGSVTLEDETSPFYVMPYYPVTLRHLMQEDIAPSKVLPLFSQVLDGVEAAHLQSVWHRDLKPENILYDPSSDLLVVADFGIAHFAEEQLHTLVKTSPRARLANFQYAAPEQRMKGQEVDHRSDIYALGVILNEMFTGTLLQGSGYKTISSVDPEYGFLDDLVEIMIRQLPADRPPSIDSVKQRLIAAHNEFVSRQRLSKLRDEVVPSSQVDDPLIHNPVKIVRVDYHDSDLILFLSQPINPDWVDSFRSIRWRRTMWGGEPGNFRFEVEKATIPLRDKSQAQDIVDNFKRYLGLTNIAYKKRVEKRHLRSEQAQRERLQAQIQEEETRQRILENVEI
jgi:serine/threonine protein kinase